MKCPKCKEELKPNTKFCTKCGADIEKEKAKIEEQKRKKKEEAEKKKKELEDKKKLDEIRKQEKLKKEQEQKEAEKAEAIRQAKEEGIEFEIIDKEPEEIQEEHNGKEFKIKENKAKPKKEKKKKVKIKKNIFQRFINKIIFMLVTAAIIIGVVYYAYANQLLPDFAQKEIEDFDKKLQNVISTGKEVKEGRENYTEIEEKNNWEVEPNIEADDIKDLSKEVSVIVKNGKEGLIDNKTGEIVLEPRYTGIFYIEYYDIGKTEEDKTKGIVVKDIEKYYKVDSKYQISTEVTTITPIEEGTYFYEHHDAQVYYASRDGETKKADTTSKKELKVCTDIDLVTTEGIAAKDDELPENFKIDFEKSKITTKGYCDTSKAELVINCDYDEAYEFCDGYAAVKVDKKAGIIDENGNKVIELEYDETRSVHGDKAFAKQNGKWGILNIK